MSMNQIYKPRFPHDTHIDEKFSEFRAKVQHLFDTPLSNNDDLMVAMRFIGQPEDFHNLNESISLDHLSHPNDMRISDYDPAQSTNRRKTPVVPKEAIISLQSISTLVGQKNLFSDSHFWRYVKYNKHRHIRLGVDNSHADIRPGEETLLVVRVYEPFKYKNNSNIRMKPKLRQRFNVLASQTLTELRDRIFCHCHQGPFYDISRDPNQAPLQHSEKPFDHGFFFINDTFYNDTRQLTCDYSVNIRSWAEGRENVGDFKVESMENFTFGQLAVRLGSPCVFQHHGNCEHVFTFSDLRLIGPGDSLNRKDYPQVDMISLPTTVCCMTCGDTATRVVFDSNMHLHDPTYLCVDCFESFHYVNGQKLGEFRAYRFKGHDDVTLMSMK